MHRRGFLAGLSALALTISVDPASALMVSVTGSTVADIHAAVALAGINGKVFFPNDYSPYDADGVTASVANQTWEFEKGAVLLRSPTSASSLLTLQVPLDIVGGVLDGNRANNTNPGQGITAFVNGCDLRMRGTVVQNVNSWGVGIWNARLWMDDCVVKNTTLACIQWRVTGGSGTIAPQLYRCTFDRSQEPGATIDSGCVLIGSSTGTPLAIAPRIVDCDFLMPYTSALNAVLCEFLFCQRGTVSGGRWAGGRIGFSNAESIGTEIKYLKCQSQYSYAIEVGGSDTLVFGNYGTGSSACLDGISVNHTHTGSLKVVANDFTGYTRASLFDPSNRITAQWAN